MKNQFSTFALSLLAATALLALTPAATRATSPPPEDPKYTAAIEKRTTDILDLLKVSDPAAKAAVHDIIMGQYRALNAWQQTHESTLKALKKQANDKDTNVVAQAKLELDRIQAARKQLHDQYLAKLSGHLTPEQVELVKDKMTYFKVRVTYDTYCEILPNLTGEQKAKVLAWLKEARELAMDGVSTKEKDDIFNKYKGRINNYLSKEGINMTQATKEWNERRNAKPATNAAAPVK